MSQELVIITKAQHIELVMQANYWKSLHARAVRREQWRHERFGRIVHQLREQAGKREADLLAELALMRARIRDLRQRVFGRKSERSKGASELANAYLDARANVAKGPANNNAASVLPVCRAASAAARMVMDARCSRTCPGAANS